MAAEDLNGTLATPKRDEIVAKYKRDFSIRVPGADVLDGSKVDAEARTLADTVLPIYSDCVLVQNAINEDAATGTRLDRVGARIGVARPQATGATGFVQVSAAAGGGNITIGLELENPQTKQLYEAAEDLAVENGDHVLVSAVSTGAGTNVRAGTVLQWTAPPPGIGPNATVVTQADGTGLSGGAPQADDAQYLLVIQEARQNPPAAVNDAAIRKVIRETPDLPVQEVFSYPAIFGSGSHGFTFTVTPVTLGASRLPSGAQLTAAAVTLGDTFDSDDSFFDLAIVADAKTIVLQLDWDLAIRGWQDAPPWPPYYATTPAGGTPGGIVVSAVTSASAWTLATNNTVYTGIIQPSGTKLLAFWDSSALVFRKKICTFTGTGPWTVSSTAQTGHDRDYVPIVGQRAFPWSDSLVELVTPVLTYFGTLGPGEQYSTLTQDGRRRRRHPKPPKKWPATVTNALTTPLLALASTANVVLTEGNNATPAVGTPGVSVRLITIGDLAVFPLTQG